jgi:hypothetical protein
MQLLVNAFSLNMLAVLPARVGVVEIDLDTARELAPVFISAVGHETTAALFSRLLGREVNVNRVSLKLAPDDILLVGQYSGPRLPEGATELPEGATIRWLLVHIGGVDGEGSARKS